VQLIVQREFPTLEQTAAVGSSAMAVSGLKPFLCVDTYLPTAFAMSVRHDALVSSQDTALEHRGTIDLLRLLLRVSCSESTASFHPAL
jgi:hypothetical protein